MTVELQRVVFPPEGRDDALHLYVEHVEPVDTADGRTGTRSGPRLDLVRGRRSHLVPAGSRVSLASYANAFPASYWRHWTVVGEVAVEVEIEGDCVVEVHGTDAEGAVRMLALARPDEAGQVRCQIDLGGFDFGGWCWLELVGGADDAMLRAARWVAVDVAEPAAPPTISIGITTMNRVESCAHLVAALAGDEAAARAVGEEPRPAAGALTDFVDRLYVVDQGSDRLRDSPEFGSLEAAWGGRLRVIEQANLGGSGGFARSQAETLAAGESDFVLLLDDDVDVDVELLRRMVVFGGLCRQRAIVGSQMLSLSQPTRLHAMAEHVSTEVFDWGPVDPEHRDHDFATKSLRSATWLHRRVDASYNGWWACLIPTSVLRDVGLALPLFLKWDDAEFGLRAAAVGVPTVTLAGAGVWHVPWWDKDDTVDWQAYFNQRNRLIAALLHSPHRRGGRLVPMLFAHQVKHLVAMQYAAAELRRVALADVARGPGVLHAELDTALRRAADLRESFSDAEAVVVPSLVGTTHHPANRPSRWGVLGRAARGTLRHARRPSEAAAAPVLRHDEAPWWELATRDTAVVVAADGKGAVRYQRSRRSFFHLLGANASEHARLWRHWRKLSDTYRAEAPNLASPETWAKTFDRANDVR